MNIELDVIVLCSCEIQNNKSKYRGIKKLLNQLRVINCLSHLT